MAKEKKSGLGRGLDSLIPKIEEQEIDEGISLEDLLKKSEEAGEKEEIVEEKETTEDEIFEDEPVDEDKELVFTEDDFIKDEDVKVEESDVEKYEEEIAEEELDDEEMTETSTYTNVLNNDDEKIGEKNVIEKVVENINSTVNLNEEKNETTKIIEASDDLNNVESLLSEKEEKLIDEVIETVENNPRITLWSARSAAVLRYLRKTEPEFSISSEASDLIDKAIAEKYPEIWTLFNHL